MMLIKVIAMHDDGVRYLAQGLGYKQKNYMIERRAREKYPRGRVYLLTSNKANTSTIPVGSVCKN